MWQPRQYVSRPIRSRTIVAACPACGVETKMHEVAAWDYAAEVWRLKRGCWNVECMATWSLLHRH